MCEKGEPAGVEGRIRIPAAGACRLLLLDHQALVEPADRADGGDAHHEVERLGFAGCGRGITWCQIIALHGHAAGAGIFKLDAERRLMLWLWRARPAIQSAMRRQLAEGLL